jgi:hypothetical protein
LEKDKGIRNCCSIYIFLILKFIGERRDRAKNALMSQVLHPVVVDDVEDAAACSVDVA